MDEIEQSQQIANENGFELTTKYGSWLAIHTMAADDQVFAVWCSHYGKNPLSVAQAAIGARYNPIVGPLLVE